MKRRLLVIGLWLILPVAGVLVPLAVFAKTSVTSTSQNQGFNAEISPLPILLNAKPGTTVTTNLRVRNGGTQPEQLEATLKTYTEDGPSGKINLHDPVAGDDFLNWVSFSPKVFNAPAGLWQNVKMTVTLPKNADYGYYWAVVFQLANPPKSQPGSTNLQGAVAIFVLLNAQGPGETKQARVTDFSADHRSYEFLPVNFTVRVRNTGNIHLTAYGNIFITRGKHQVANLVVNPTQGLILPGSNRQFNISWNSGFPVYQNVFDASGQPVTDSHGNIKRKLVWNFSQVSKLRFGHYTANLALIYNDGTRDIPITGTLSFWVIPWRLAIGVLVILVLTGVGTWSSLRRFGRFTKHQAGRVKSRGGSDKSA